ncbi:MAG: hypothetical protein HZA16_07625 [Nitrospirae bacterium]|nr:hypothetical protein [Nitrospirota bacterium]
MKKLMPGLTTLLFSLLGLSSVSNATAPPDLPPIAPEPVSSILFIVGGAALAARHLLKKKRP